MSIRKRTWKTAKGEAKEAWVVDYVDQGGKRRLKTFERKKEASAFAATATVEIKHGLHTPESELPTVSEAAAAWISDCDNLERATLVKLSRLSTPMVCDFRDKLRSGEPAPGESEGRVRSPVLIRKVMTSLGSLIGHAKERGKFAGANPVRELGKSKRGVHRRRGEKRQKGRLQVGRDIPSPEEIKRLLGAATPRQKPILMIAAFCGLRASELRGLRWIDIDMKRSELHVRQRADRYLKIGPPKSEAGERKVPVPPGVLAAMKEWKLAGPKSDLGLVFPSASGKIQHP